MVLQKLFLKNRKMIGIYGLSIHLIVVKIEKCLFSQNQLLCFNVITHPITIFIIYQIAVLLIKYENLNLSVKSK